MGVSIIYSAIPPGSTLYARLQREQPLAVLMVYLFPYGCGVFHFFELPPDEINEILEDVIEEHYETFASELAADEAIAEFRSELRRTRQAFPGIETRRVSLEKTSNRIAERLLHELLKRQITNADEIVQKLMFGDRTFAPDLLPVNESLGLISREWVHEGASILRQIEPEALFTGDDGWEEYCLHQLKSWKKLYLAADQKGEEILVEVVT